MGNDAGVAVTAPKPEAQRDAQSEGMEPEALGNWSHGEETQARARPLGSAAYLLTVGLIHLEPDLVGQPSSCG